MTTQSDGTLQEIGRLALRVEGDWWVAYYAKPDTMDDAIEMARVKIGVVMDEERKRAFMDLMRSGVSDFLFEMTGEHPNWTGERRVSRARAEWQSMSATQSGYVGEHQIICDRDTGTAGSLREIHCSCGWQIIDNWNYARWAFEKHQ